MRVLQQQPFDLRVQFRMDCPGGADRVGKVADQGKVGVDLSYHPGMDQGRIVFRADVHLAEIESLVLPVEDETQRHDHRGDEHGGDDGEASIRDAAIFPAKRQTPRRQMAASLSF